MLRTLIGATYAAAWITLSPGCTTTMPATGLFSRVTETADDADDTMSTAELRARLNEAASTGAADVPARAATLASQTGPATQTTPAPALDSATLYLIESELRDLPAAERQTWMAYLETIDPRSVPYVLQARRMTVNAARGGSQNPQPPSAAGTSQPHVAGTFAPRTPSGVGGAMSQMHLDAPEPPGSPPVITPFGGHESGPRHTSAGYLYGQSGDSTAVMQTHHEAQAQLPRISPGSYERGRGMETGGEAATATNFEPAPMARQQPVSSGQDAYLQEAMQRVIALTEAEAAASNPGLTEQERLDYIRRHVALRMLLFMSGQPHRAQQAIPDVHPADQEFWTELFWSLSNYFDVAAIPDPAERTALAAAQLESASRHLEHQAQLELWNASFCHKITSFGNFETYDRDEFRPGQPVLLYAELRNFQSQPTSSGQFRTQLKSYIEIRRGGIDGERIEYNAFPPTEDLCRTPRNDYFHSYKIDLPHHLTPGPHALVLTVEDVLSGKVATEVLDFVVQ